MRVHLLIIILPESDSDKDGEVVTPGELSLFTNASKIAESNGAGVFFNEFDYEETISVSDDCPVLFLVLMGVADRSIC